MDDPPDVATLINGLVADNEEGDGLYALRQAVLETTGNMQAYAFGSLDALLELDMGWDMVDGAIIEKAVSLAVTHPLVNIVRNVLTLLVLIVSRPLSKSRRQSADVFGFQAIKPALDKHPGFLDSLVQRLSDSDHTLCANALQLINALMRDAVIHGGEHEWPKFIKRLQDLGVIGGVGMLMRGDTASDPSTSLAAAILEFQGLNKVLLRKWREVRVNIELPEHKRALKTIHLLSKPQPLVLDANGETHGKGSKKHHPEKWRRLGFETESPAWEFDETGYLGMMDLVDYARRNEDAYQKILMEQSMQPREQRCPLARAALSVTLILYEHFEIEDASETEAYSGGHVRSVSARGGRLDSQANVDKLYRPLLLQWGRLHTAAVNAFMRMWKAAGAELEDFFKIEEVVRIVVERIVGAANRKTDVGKVEDELRSVTLETARRWQMAGMDEVYDDAWGPHLVQVREQLHQESLQFMKEQRIRCLLQGSWFPTSSQGVGASWRYVRLSRNKRWLHYQNFSTKGSGEPAAADLAEKLDLNMVTSVDSNVSASDKPLVNGLKNSSSETLKEANGHDAPQQTTNTKVTILGTLGKPPKPSLPPTPTHTHTNADDEETVLLELFPQTSSAASEWLDGLLMLLNQQPITKDTTRLVDMMEDWGVRLRLLNLRWEDVDWEAFEARVTGVKVVEREVPSREGVGEEYYYGMAEA
ncbi:hypothetical protein LTR12_009998 [Friedmanniomyces endolithicus]|nr:hypothetical protein LTR12_009998 [Friedmanniomyces endolithicus]